MHKFKELLIWRRSIKLAKDIYQLSKDLPKEESYGLSYQIRKSAVSVPSNIAEGCGRNSNPQLIQFLKIALGSLAELETQLILINEIGLLKIEDALFDEIISIQKMTNVFRLKLAA